MNSKFVVIFFTTIFCLFLAPISLVRAEFAHNHIYKISGSVTYENQPWAGNTVQLYEYDHLHDDHMGEAVTDQEGKFVINGSEDEEKPEPYLYLRSLVGIFVVFFTFKLSPKTKKYSIYIYIGI